MISVQLPSKIEAKLTSYAEALGQSESKLVYQAIVDFLEEMDDITLAGKRLSEGNNTLSIQDMRQRLGLQD